MYGKHAMYLLLTAASLSLCLSRAEASPEVNVSINGYLPAPPGVIVRVDAGRPYYVQNERRVYIERERPRHARGRRHKRDRGRYEKEAHGHGHHGGR
jgi:hypothetical protein